MLTTPSQLSSLIPHRAPFVQVDALIRAGESDFITEFTITTDNLLVVNGYFSEAGMLENIAQSAALGFGYNGKMHGMEPKVGYIGAISRVSVIGFAAAGERITTSIEVTHRMDPVVMVRGVCYRNGEKLLEGEIKLVI